MFTLFNVIWPWSALPKFRRQQLTPPTKFHVHTPMCTQFDLIDLWMTPDDLELTFKIFWTNNWPHPPSFMSIHQCVPYFNSFDLRWPLMTSKWPSKFLASLIDSTHQVSCPYTTVYPIWSHLTLDDPWRPWSYLQFFRRQQFTPPTKFHVHTPMFTAFDHELVVCDHDVCFTPGLAQADSALVIKQQIVK